MNIVIAVVIGVVVGFGLGYGFRGAVRKELGKLKAEILSEFNKIKTKL